VQMQQRVGDPASLALLGAGLVFLIAFVFVERRAAAPIVPLRLFALRDFNLASAYTFLLYAALGGVLFFVPFELQHVMRFTPLGAGLALLPTIALIAVCSPLSGMLAVRTGTRVPLVAGAGAAALGFALFARLGAGASYLGSVLPATVVLGLGLGVAIAPLITTVMGAAGSSDAGAASGLNNAISRVGNLVAIAVFGIVIAASGGGALPAAAHPEGFAHAMLGAGALAFAAAVFAVFLAPPARRLRGDV
jgi:hypothetical protein